MVERKHNPASSEVIHVAPELPTRALKLSVKNYFWALAQTPIGREFPLPTIAKVKDPNVVEVSGGRLIHVDDPETDMVAGRRVIIYKQGLVSQQTTSRR